MTRLRALLRDSARHSIDAASWFARYERSQNPEHRRNALLALMDARDLLQQAEASVTHALDQPPVSGRVA